ncbi:hypothetical protein GCM10012275_13390 [Longimycelium tulufanense]|uniref:Uncharacterized protein n=1 Tax=Longimycelium tulufanense TaxID=907463 RepID=A0A8J3C6W1_9PSEU|nr:hypothetical protein [Longimycelium tulufanense]GGM43721.1 hypothetical protein GCM10012275_13390 [Longimycelium tulufanense]
MTTPAQDIVLDTTAVLAVGAQNRFASALIARALHDEWRLIIPITCLWAAERQRRGMAWHFLRPADVGGFAGLTGFALAELTAPAIVAITSEETFMGWDLDIAHAIQAALPSLDYPEGLAVATTTPDPYKASGLVVYNLRTD